MSFPLAHLATIEMLESMYPEELHISPSSAPILRMLRESHKLGHANPRSDHRDPMTTVYCSLNIPIEHTQAYKPAQVEICFKQDTSCPSLLVKQPDWLSKAQYQALLDSLPRQSTDSDAFLDDLFEFIDHLKQAIPVLLDAAALSAPSKVSKEPVVEGDGAGLHRVWFWLFVSISPVTNKSSTLNILLAQACLRRRSVTTWFRMHLDIN